VAPAGGGAKEKRKQRGGVLPRARPVRAALLRLEEAAQPSGAPAVRWALREPHRVTVVWMARWNVTGKEYRTPQPELKQGADLVRGDFDRHPLWVGVHTADSGRPWYEMCDEDTYRPWDDRLPASAEQNVLLAAAWFELKNGSRLRGFFCPTGVNWDEPIVRAVRGGGTIRLRSMSERHGGSQLTLDLLQRPEIFVGEKRFHFVGGRRGIAPDMRQSFYAAVGATPDRIFPMRFTADSGLISGIQGGEARGFYRLVPSQPPAVEF
jgi:hypothetical protein